MLVLLVALTILVARAVPLWRARGERTRRWWLGWSVPALALVVVLVQAERSGASIEAKKCLALLIMPAGLLWAALAVGALWSAFRRRWKLAGVWAALFALEFLAGNVWVGAALMGGLEKRIPPTDVAAAVPYDAVFVCGGATDAGVGGRSEVTASGDRVLYAVELYRQGKTRMLVSSGSALASMEDARDIAAETASIWMRLGVRPEDIVQLPGPHVTSEEVAAYREEAHRRAWTHVGLITSAWHMPRAQRLCARAGFSADPLPCDHRSRMLAFSPVWLIPQEKGFQRVQLALWEYLGLLGLR